MADRITFSSYGATDHALADPIDEVWVDRPQVVAREARGAASIVEMELRLRGIRLMSPAF